MADALLTIGRLASRAGVPVSTLRYYERAGLIGPIRRAGSGRYRLYDGESLSRLRFIRSAQSAGFTLGDIRVLLEYREGGRAPCDRVQGLIEQRLERVERELAHLAHVRGVLTRWRDACREGARRGRCAVLEGLEPIAGGVQEKQKIPLDPAPRCGADNRGNGRGDRP